jgi:hypothetical protein
MTTIASKAQNNRRTDWHKLEPERLMTMKLKVVMIVAVLVASSIVFAAGELTSVKWYNGGIAEGWPTARYLRGCSWNWNADDVDAEFRNGYLEVDSTISSPVSCVANHNADFSRGKVEQTVTIIPYVEQTRLGMPDGNFKTGLGVLLVSNLVTSVVSSNYYCLAKDTTTNKWVQLEGATYNGGEITLKTTLRHDEVSGKSYVNFTVTPAGGDSVDMTYLGSNDIEIVVSDLQSRSVDFCGFGKVRGISATKEARGTSLIPGMMFNR